MTWFERVKRRLRILLRRDDVESELAEEVRLHLDMEAEELVRHGWDPADARREAHRRFGGVERAKEWVRDERGGRLLDDLVQDVRFGGRLLIRNRGFTLAAATMLSLGIGANAAVFTISNAVFIRGLPFDEPDRLVRVWAINPRGGRWPPLERAYEHWRSEARSLSDLAGHQVDTINISEEGEAPERVMGAYVTANLFRLLGQAPLMGRDFADADDQPGAEPVTMIGHRVWQNRYGGDPTVLGRTLKANGQIVTIVGVMPPDMRFPDNVDVWLPLAQLPSRTGPLSTRSLQVIGRLADGVTIEQARVELASINQPLAEAFPERNANGPPYVMPYGEWTIDGAEIPFLFLLLQGAVVLVLLIGCANVAGLLLARSAHRAHEVAVRVSLGASRRRVVRQLLVESVLLALIAGLAGVGVAVVGVRWADAALRNVGLPSYMAFTLDGTVVAFMAAVCLATGIIFGLVPALHASKIDVHEVLQEGGRSGTGGLRARRWSSVLIVAEIALTVVLLAGAGFMMRSFLTYYRIDVGIDTSRLLTMKLSLPLPKYREVGVRTELFRQVEERLAGITEIDVSALVDWVPLDYGTRRSLVIDGRSAPVDEPPPMVLRLTVGDRYFETLDVGMQRGRGFTRGDGRPGQASAIVNRRFVAMHFPDENPVGRRIRLDRSNQPPGEDAPWLTIVGVSPDIRQRQPWDPDPDLVVYVPHRTISPRRSALILRTRGDPAVVTALVRDAVRVVDPDLPVFDIQTMDQLLGRQRWKFRVFSAMFSIFAAIALLLSAVGLYAVTAYAVTQRTRELGLRVALGAQPGQVQWLVLRRVVMQLAIGLPIGLAGAFGVGRLLQSVPEAFDAAPLLVQTSPADPVTLVSIVAVLVGAAVLACLGPARRAARVDPMVALRHE